LYWIWKAQAKISRPNGKEIETETETQAHDKRKPSGNAKRAQNRDPGTRSTTREAK
jgi:hypothetical protein